MFEMLAEMFSFGFIVRALIAGTLVSLCAALLGVSLVLKRYSMIGDGLSHVGFGAMSVSVAMGFAPLTIAMPVVVLAAFLLLRISENSKIKGDALVALVSASALAVGIVATSLTSGLNADVYGYMFGSVLAMTAGDVWLSAGLSAVVLAVYILFYNRLFSVTFDEGFAAATGVNVRLYSMLLALLTAVVVVIGMRMMGALLISSLVIFPALTSMRIAKSYKGVVLGAAAMSVICFFVGMVASYLLKTPVGASVVLTNLAAFGICWAVGKFR